METNSELTEPQARLDDYSVDLGVAIGSLTLLSASGLLPRVGPGRAAVLALQSLLRPSLRPMTVRSSELQQLKRRLSFYNWNSHYMVVAGPKNVGKSYLLESATRHTAGVTHVRTTSMETVMRAVTNLQLNHVNVEPSFRRVLWWYRVLTLGKTPVVVIHAEECGEKKFFDLLAAVKATVKRFPIRVILDPSLEESIFIGDGRCIRMHVDFMDETMIEAITEFNQVRAWLKEQPGLYPVAKELLGGSPQSWSKLVFNSTVARMSGADSETRREFLERHVAAFYEDAHVSVANALENYPDLRKVAKLYFAGGERPLSLDTLVGQGLKRPHPDYIFRDHPPGFIQPATRALRYVLKYGRAAGMSPRDVTQIVTAELQARRNN